MNFRDVELLSAYLDGQLDSSDSKRLESRLASDPDLREIMNDLHEARGLLRKLPARKAPRNFTLTRKMVGLKPPLPRTYFTFRFATVLATLLLFCTFAVNGFASLTSGVAAPAFGVGGGGAPEAPQMEAATEPPAATEAPAAEAPFQADALPTETLAPAATEDMSRIAETPMPLPGEDQFSTANQPPVQNEPFIPSAWQIALVAIVLLSGLAALILRQSALSKWR